MRRRSGKPTNNSEPPDLTNETAPTLEWIRIRDIRPTSENPRKFIEQGKLDDLAESIRELGLIQPIVVAERSADGLHDLISGERRLRATERLGLEIIQAIVRKDYNDPIKRRLVRLEENWRREPLHPLDVADELWELHYTHGLKADALAKRFGLAVVTLYKKTRQHHLTPAVRDKYHQGSLSESQASAIADKCKSADEQQWLLDQGFVLNMPVKEYERKVDDLLTVYRQTHDAGTAGREPARREKRGRGRRPKADPHTISICEAIQLSGDDIEQYFEILIRREEVPSGRCPGQPSSYQDLNRDQRAWAVDERYNHNRHCERCGRTKSSQIAASSSQISTTRRKWSHSTRVD